MKLVVRDAPGQITASGGCAVTLPVDGNPAHKFKGTWTATLNWGGSTFSGTHTTSDCATAQA